MIGQRQSRIVPASANGTFKKGRRFAVAFGRRTFLLLAIGLALLGPALLSKRYIWAMLAWDAAVLIAWGLDLLILPRARNLRVERSWSGALMMDSTTQVHLNFSGSARTSLNMDVVVDLPELLTKEPPQLKFVFYPKMENEQVISTTPVQRGDAAIGPIYLRYESPLRLAQKLAVAEMPQTVRVYPSIGNRREQSLNLMRSRRIETVKRLSRKKGMGREFESLRDYRPDDALRDICWSASARRGKLIVKEFQIERSQPIWVMLDCGRLMRTKVGDRTKLDFAVSAALNLAEVAMFGGDRVGLLAYGRQSLRMVGLGRGDQQLRTIMDQLSGVEGELGEADHFGAASRLLRKQSRRSLIVWITDLPDTAMTPEVYEGASVLLGRHLVIFAAVADPDLNKRANEHVTSTTGVFETAAAMDVLHRRERLIAALRGRGAHTLEVSTQDLSAAVVKEFLSIRERDLL
jgi:uncharacterized protein (DUF58 family)